MAHEAMLWTCGHPHDSRTEAIACLTAQREKGGASAPPVSTRSTWWIDPPGGSNFQRHYGFKSIEAAEAYIAQHRYPDRTRIVEDDLYINRRTTDRRSTPAAGGPEVSPQRGETLWDSDYRSATPKLGFQDRAAAGSALKPDLAQVRAVVTDDNNQIQLVSYVALEPRVALNLALQLLKAALNHLDRV